MSIERTKKSKSFNLDVANDLSVVNDLTVKMSIQTPNFVAMSSAPAHSTDGITWELGTFPVSASWISIAYGDDTFVAVSQTSNPVAISINGRTWTQSTLPVSASWRSVTYGDGTFVAVARASQIAATSTNGITWTQRTLPVSGEWVSVIHGDPIVTEQYSVAEQIETLNDDFSAVPTFTSSTAEPSGGNDGDIWLTYTP